MNEIDTAIALAALLVSAASFFIAQRSAARFKKAQRIKDLLGEKETVTFGALRLLTEGLPADEAERELTEAALVQACVFEDSHRARALLFRVIDTNHARHGAGDNQFGVRHGDIRKLAAKIKTDHALAIALWGTGNIGESARIPKG